MLGWFVRGLQYLVQLGLQLAGRLVAGLFQAPVTAAQRAAAVIVVRPAGADEVIDVRHRVLREGRPRETAVFDGDEADTTQHWVAVQADRIVGVVSVMEVRMPEPHPADGPAPTRQLRGMAVLPELRGEGIGVRLLRATHAERTPMWCNAREAVVAFYTREGWHAVGPSFEIPKVGPHQRMWWVPQGYAPSA